MVSAVVLAALVVIGLALTCLLLLEPHTQSLSVVVVLLKQQVGQAATMVAVLRLALLHLRVVAAVVLI
jgi:hypothetical protein